MNKPMTPLLEERLAFIRAFMATHGYAPTYAEIARHFLVSKQSAAHVVNRLVSLGYITRNKHLPRGITLRQPAAHCPTCTCHVAPTALAPGSRS